MSLRRVLLLTTAAVALLWAGILWAVYAPPGAVPGSGGGGRVDDGVREIRVRVHAWGFSPRVVRVNPGDTVRFYVVSDDIQHGFAINEMGLNLQLVSGREVRSPTVQINLPAGKYAIHCSTFCGLGHPSMKASLIVGNPGPALGGTAPWIASFLALAASAVFAMFAAGRRQPGP